MNRLIEKFQQISYFSDAQHVVNVEAGDVLDRGRYSAARECILNWQQKKSEIKLLAAGFIGTGSLLSQRPWVRVVGLAVAGLLATNGFKHNRDVFQARQNPNIPLTNLFDM